MNCQMKKPLFAALPALCAFVGLFVTTSAEAQYAHTCTCPQYVLYHDGANYVYQAYRYNYDNCWQYTLSSDLYYHVKSDQGPTTFCVGGTAPGDCVQLGGDDEAATAKRPNNKPAAAEAALQTNDDIITIDANVREQRKTVASASDLPTIREFTPTGDWFVIKAEEQGAPFWAKVFVYQPNPAIRPQRREPLLYGFQIDPPSDEWQEANPDKIEKLTDKDVRTALREGKPDPNRSHQFKLAEIYSQTAIIRIPND